MGAVSDIYNLEVTTPLLTDKYHLPTGYAYWREGRADNPGIFYMFGRKEAQGGGYTVAGGLEFVIDIVRRWQEFGLTKEDLDFLRTQQGANGQPAFSEGYLEYLKNAKFKFKIDAAPEGSLLFPQEPVLRVEGPLAQVKILESFALCEINGHSAAMTQGARLNDVITRKMENGSPTGIASVQGLRRGPSIGAALEMSRSLGAGGYASTSTGTAAKLFGQNFSGTMDHAWIMTHGKELGDIPLAELYKMEKDAGRRRELQEAWANDAFRSYAMTVPEGGIFLLDSYEPLQGLENAITVIKEMRALSHGKTYGVRFDSGDIVEYSKIALRRFAEEGFVTELNPADVKNMSDAELLKHSERCTVFCAAADGIDEYTAQEMREKGCFIQAWGIGTAGSHVDPLGLVHKAASLVMEVGAPKDAKMTPVMKVASNAPVKSSNPGKVSSRRYYNVEGKIERVVIYDEDLGLDPDGKMVNLRNFGEKSALKSNNFSDLLLPVFDAKGEYVFQEPAKKETFPGSGRFVTDVAAISGKIRRELETLPEGARRIVRPPDESLEKALVKAFREAKKSGTPMPAVETIEASLSQEAGHIPVYIDQKLFAQRRAVEERHLGHIKNSGGVAEYKERFQP